MMKKRYAAQRITVFAVYQKFMMFGDYGRMFVAAFPSLDIAEKWVVDQKAKEPFLKDESFMIEEFSSWMKAWQP